MDTPKAKKIPYSFEVHGTKIDDEYYWLRDKNWNVGNKEFDNNIIEYLNSENSYFNNFISKHSSLKENLFEELKGRIKLSDQSTYVKKDNYYYYSKTNADSDYPIYCRKKDNIESESEILLDVNQIAKGKNFMQLGAFSISPDHKLLAYSSDETGSEKYNIKIYNLDSQEYLEDVIPDTIGSIIWHETLEGFFYTPVDDKWRHNKVMFHKLGDDYKLDKLLFHELDELYSVSLSKTSDKKYIIISVGGHDNDETHIIDACSDDFKTHVIMQRKSGVFYSVDSNIKHFYMLTNNDAENFHILRRNTQDLSNENIDLSDSWEICVPEDKEKYLEDFDLTLNYLLLNYSENAVPLMIVSKYDEIMQKRRIIKFPDPAFTADMYSTNFEEDDIRINYSSLARPSTVYKYDPENDLTSVLKIQEIPSGFDPSEYAVERIHADCDEDGVKIPITLLYKKELFKKDGTNPLYLYGYGSYGHGISVSFRNSMISIVNRGCVFAIAHIRGGDELGHNWYKSAKFLNKKRTFNDFVSVTSKLINDKYTDKGNIVIVGGSAGGMLIGNVINEHPDLYKAAIAHVPFVDVLNTMLDETLPLTPGEFKEWGNPKDKEYFDYIRSYSPYDNVKEQNYPNLFVTAGLSDPRVGYWEAAKWVAKLRDKKTDNNEIFFKTNMEFGHGGASGRFDYLYEIAEELIFIFNVFGIKDNV